LLRFSTGEIAYEYCQKLKNFSLGSLLIPTWKSLAITEAITVLGAIAVGLERWRWFGLKAFLKVIKTPDSVFNAFL